jgi:ABC-type uncharacterized transport system substrate-binding protein
MTEKRPLLAALVLAGCVFAAPVAEAHPHVLVDAKSEILFDGEGRIAAVRHSWQFDEAFSSYAMQGLDTNNDGEMSPEELQPLAKVNVESLHEFAFFTYLTIDDKELAFLPPTEYWLELRGDKLTLFYSLPLKEPAKVGAKTTLEVYDPEYFVAFTFVKDDPIAVVDAPAGCAAVYHPPVGVDDETMAMLGALPAEEKELPPELADAASDLANVVTVTCP